MAWRAIPTTAQVGEVVRLAAHAWEVKNLAAAAFAEVPLLFPMIPHPKVVVRRSRATRHAAIVDADLISDHPTLELVIKTPTSQRPISGSRAIEEMGQDLLVTFDPEGSQTQVRVPRIYGRLSSGAIVMERVLGSSLDRELEVTWLRQTEKPLAAILQSLGQWLRAFHSRGRVAVPIGRGYPFWIRPYHWGQGEGTDIDDLARRTGIPRPSVTRLRLALGKALDNLAAFDQPPALSYGDFRAWNVLCHSDTVYIVDPSDSPAVDTTWSDICAFLTSLEYLAARPSAFVARRKHVNEWASKAFLEGYFGIGRAPHLDSVELLKSAAFLASLADLESPQLVADAAARLWITARLKRQIAKITPA